MSNLRPTIYRTGKDYDTILASLDLNATAILPEWKGRDDSDHLWVLMKLLASITDVEMFYIDLAVSEMNPSTVQLYSNMVLLAEQVGYRPKFSSGAVTDLEINLVSGTTDSAPYTFYRGDTFTTSSGVTFFVTQTTVAEIGQTYVVVPVQYGTFIETTLATANGSEFQSYTLNVSSVQNNSLEVYIDEGAGYTTWEEIDTLILAGEEDKVYEVRANTSLQYVIYFGDGFNGKIPIDTATIKIAYSVLPATQVNDDYGNVTANSITSSATHNGVISTIEHAAATGGVSNESATSLRRHILAYRNYPAMAGTIKSIELLAESVAGVAKATANYIGALTVGIYVIPEGGGTVSSALATTIYDYVKARSVVGPEFEILAPTLIEIDVTISVTVEDHIAQDDLETLWVSLITEYINDENSAYSSLYLKDLYSLLNLNADGVISYRVDDFNTAGVLGVPSLGILEIGWDEYRTTGTITVNVTGGR